MRILLNLILLGLLWSILCERNKYLQFPKDRVIPDRTEEPEHYAVLKCDPIGKLPEQFSICGSIFIGYFRDIQMPIRIFKDDQSNWFRIEIDEQNFATEKYSVWLVKGTSYVELSRNMTLNPWSWSHVCISLDTFTEQMIIVINGMVMMDDILTDFGKYKPQTLERKIVYGDYTGWARVYQSESSLSNINVFSSKLTEADMIGITQRGDCTLEGDYLAWRKMEWSLFGNVTMEDTEQEMCEKEARFNNMFVFTEEFHWDTCMYLCPKIRNGRVPGVANTSQVRELTEWTKKAARDYYAWPP